MMQLRRWWDAEEVEGEVEGRWVPGGAQLPMVWMVYMKMKRGSGGRYESGIDSSNYFMHIGMSRAESLRGRMRWVR